MKSNTKKISAALLILLGASLPSCTEPPSGYDPNVNSNNAADMQAADMTAADMTAADMTADAGEDMEPASACEPACADATPICDEDAGVCVACLADADCSGDTPVCDTEANACVGCLADADCSEGAPVCDTEANTCVGCLADEDCSGDAPVCDTEANTCVGCLADADCAAPEASRCDVSTKSCAACEEASQCGHLGLNQCVDGACKACTVATEADDCGDFACLPDLTCGDTPRGTLRLCQPCQADAECGAPSRCVPMNFGDPAQFHGNYCLRPVAETCEQPYRVALRDRESVSGAPAEDYCGLYEVNTTCEALGDLLLAKECATDDDCGVTGLDDGLCRDVLGTEQCTIGCGDDAQCTSGRSCEMPVGEESYCR